MKLTQLNESIKFTNREKRIVEKEAKDILIGVEYEYHVSKEKASEFSGERFSDKETVYLNDIYEYNEYQEAESQAISDRVEERMEMRKSDFVNEYEEELMDEHSIENFGEFIGIVTDSASGNQDLISLLAVPSVWYAFSNILKKVNQYGINDLTDDEKQKAISYATDFSILVEYFSRFKDEYYDITETEEFLTDTGIIKENPPLDDLFTDYADKYDMIENITGLTGMDLKFAGAGDPEQSIFVFDEYEDDLNEMFETGIFDNGEIKHLISFSEVLYYIIINYHRIRNRIYDKIEDLVKEEWEEVRDNIYEEESEEVINYGVHEDLDIDEIVAEIQNNHDVIVVNYEGDPVLDGDAVDSEVNIIKNLLKYDNEWDIDYDDIENITTDPSVMRGVELITKPLPLKEALSFMKKMFNHITDVGQTSDMTGMHVNMSFRGLKLSRQNFDPVKFAMLSDVKTTQALFPVRNYVGEVVEKISIEKLIKLARTSDILDEFRELIQLNQKYKGINFTHINSLIESQRRLELRYFGGADYEQRYPTIEWAIYRFAYVMFAAFSEGFAEKEYRKAVIKTLDNALRTTLNSLQITNLLTYVKYTHNADVNKDIDKSFITFREVIQKYTRTLRDDAVEDIFRTGY